MVCPSMVPDVETIFLSSWVGNVVEDDPPDGSGDSGSGTVGGGGPLLHSLNLLGRFYHHHRCQSHQNKHSGLLHVQLREEVVHLPNSLDQMDHTDHHHLRAGERARIKWVTLVSISFSSTRFAAEQPGSLARQ